jgi:hypothetical protein
MCLRLTAWIDQTGCRRDPRTGFSRGGGVRIPATEQYGKTALRNFKSSEGKGNAAPRLR